MSWEVCEVECECLFAVVVNSTAGTKEILRS